MSSAERQRKPRYARTLVDFIASAVSSAREMGHTTIMLGHFGMHLSDEYRSSLTLLGLDERFLESSLPQREAQKGRSSLQANPEVTLVLKDARNRALYGDEPEVTIGHVFDAMLDNVDRALSLELKFSRSFSEPLTILRRPSSQKTEAA